MRQKEKINQQHHRDDLILLDAIYFYNFLLPSAPESGSNDFKMLKTHRNGVKYALEQKQDELSLENAKQ